MSEQIYISQFNTLFADAHYYVDAFHHRNSYHHHMRGVTDPDVIEAICSNLEGVQFHSSVGCWMNDLDIYMRGVIIDNPSKSGSFGFVSSLAADAATRWGSQVSIHRERAISQLLQDTILLSHEERQAKWTEFDKTLNDCTLTWRSGQSIGTLINKVMTPNVTEPERPILVNEAFKFDAPAQLRIKGIQLSDTTPAKVLDLDIAPKFKGSITVTDGTNTESITDSAENDYTLTGSDFNTQFDKLTQGLYRDRELVIDIAGE